MEQFIIAGLKTEYNVRGELLKTRSEKYRAEFDSSQTDIRIEIREGFLEKKQEEIPYLTPDENEPSDWPAGSRPGSGRRKSPSHE